MNGSKENMNECELCFQVISVNRRLCDACEEDKRKAEREFHERQARACTTE
jgi:recombinational DNA repair protein RecR